MILTMRERSDLHDGSPTASAWVILRFRELLNSRESLVNVREDLTEQVRIRVDATRVRTDDVVPAMNEYIS